MGDELATRDDRVAFRANEAGALRPTNLAEAMQLSKILAASDFVPPDYVGKPGNVLAALQMGAEVGLAPMQALQNIAVINGRPSVWGDAALALCRVHSQWGGIEETQANGVATCRVTRIDRGREQVTERTFSMDDAKAAGLAGKKGPWQQYPRRMCQMRARAFALRDTFPDALKGLQLGEEMRDIIDVTPSPERASEPVTKASSGTTGDHVRREHPNSEDAEQAAIDAAERAAIEAEARESAAVGAQIYEHERQREMEAERG